MRSEAAGASGLDAFAISPAGNAGIRFLVEFEEKGYMINRDKNRKLDNYRHQEQNVSLPFLVNPGMFPFILQIRCKNHTVIWCSMLSIFFLFLIMTSSAM